MAAVILSRRWTTKPPLGVQIDRGHPRAHGLVGLWLFNESGGQTVFDLGPYAQHGAFVGSTVWKAAQAGVSLDFLNSTSNYINVPDHSAQKPGTADFSVGCLFRQSSHFMRPVTKRDVCTTGNFWNLGTHFFEVCESGSAPTKYVSANPGSTFHDGNLHHAHGQRQGATVWFYLDGGRVSTSSTNADGTANITTTQPMRFAWDVCGQTMNGELYFVYLYNRVLTPNEIRDWWDRPYDILIPQSPTRRYWINAAAAAGDPEGLLIGGKLIGRGLLGGVLVN